VGEILSMKWQRNIGLLLAGAGVVALALWFSRQNQEPAAAPPGKPGTNILAARPAVKAPSGTNVARKTPATPTTSQVARTNVRTAALTNAPAVKPSGTNFVSSLQTRLQQLKQHRAFYPAAVAIPFLLGLILLWLSARPRKDRTATGGATTAAATPAAIPSTSARTRKKARAANVQQCNVLHAAGDTRHLWQFGVRGGRVSLHRDQRTAPGESLPLHLVQKDWRSLWQKKLNVAWLPPEQVFLRVVQLPPADFEETLQMVELQLEKLSPMPVAQVAWTMHVLSSPAAAEQTVVLIVVARSVVEEILGRLENEGYMADRLELPLLDQLLAINPDDNGAWVFPNTGDGAGSAMAAWFYDGVLRHLELITPAPENRAESLKEQLFQTAWAGELEGWATSPPKWHLVADAATASLWEGPLREGLQQEVQVVSPPAPAEMAASSAARATQAHPRSTLVPPEYATRYQQQVVDRLWMRALGAVVMLYIIGVGIYLVAVQVALFRTKAVEAEVAALSATYTNAIQLRAQYQVLKDRQELKFAALDCWKAVAEHLPETLQLENFNFTEGRRLVLQGTAPVGQVQQIYQFDGALRKVQVNGQNLFDPTKGESPSYQTAPGGTALNWNFTLELRRSEAQ